MTRIGHQQLTQANRTGVIQYDRTIEYLVIYNNNPVPVYIRLGSPEIPTQRNFDISVPPNYIMGISVDSNQFAFRLGDDNVTLALITGVTVIEGMIDEPPPALGGVPIQGASLSTADLNNGFQQFTVPTVYGPFNLTLWGGMLVTLIPDAGSGQGVIQVSVSSDNVTYSLYGTYAFWRSIPVTLLLPRVGTFVKITVANTTIVGEPALSGKISVRGTLTELTQSSYTPQGNSIVKTWAIAALGSVQFSFVTAGLPAISLAAIETSGGVSPVVQILVEASSDNVNWRYITDRTVFLTTGQTLYRSFSNLDLFVRISLFELGGTSASNGSLYMSIPSQPDTASMLNNIYKAMGDPGSAVPVGTFPDSYHELDQIRLNIGTTNTNLSTIHTDLVGIDAKLQTQINFLSTINTTAQSIDTKMTTVTNNQQTEINYLSTINTTTQTSDGRLATINTTLSTMNTTLSTISTQLGTINTSIGTVNTSIGTTNTSLATLTAAQTRGGGIITGFIPAMPSGVFANAGAFFTPGQYITAAQASLGSAVATGNNSTQFAWGTGAGAVFIFYSSYITQGAMAAGVFNGAAPTVEYFSLRSVGLLIPATMTNLWILTNAPAGATVGYNIATTP